MSIRTRLAVGAAAALAILAPATAAHAATAPVVAGPSSPVTTGPQRFTWALGPGGELVTAIHVDRTDPLGADGLPATTATTVTLAALDSGASTSAVTRTPLHAGTWTWRAAWRTPDPVAPAETGWTAASTFVVPTVLRRLAGRYVQDVHSTAFDTSGSFRSNAATARVTCAVRDGRTLVAQRTATVRPSTTRRTAFRCPRMQVPERLDGRQLALRVTVRGAGRSLGAVQRFVAT